MRTAKPQVLVTRPAHQAAATAQRLAGRGYHPVLAPVTEIAPLAADLPAASSVQAVIVTSANALPAITAAFQPIPLFAVGDATTQAAARRGLAAESAAGDARDLACLVTRRCDPQAAPLLLLHGEGHGAALAATLRAAGHEVATRAVYAVRPLPHLPGEAAESLAAGRIAAALFHSRETAGVFVRLCREAGLTAAPGTADAIAIAASTAEALAGLPWRRVHVALRPNEDDMLALLQ